MGLYRAQLNLPILRFGKSALLDDDDPRVRSWLASGALVRVDDNSAFKVPGPTNDVVVLSNEPAEPEVTAEREALLERRAKRREADSDDADVRPSRRRRSTTVTDESTEGGDTEPAVVEGVPADQAPQTPTSGGLSPDLGIRFD